jgi:phenylalanyl-tRNA synthetase alpha chain
MHMEDAASLERQGRDQLERATTAAELEDARVEALGRSSALTLALRELGALPAELRGARGQDLNRVRGVLEKLHSELREGFETRELDAALRTESIDVTLPGDPVPRGTSHLLTQIQREIEDVFVGLGFGIAEGPEVELEYYNFTALNTPDDHPSKAESDTLWIGPDVCLRTQTSPVQVRVMESQPPPVYVICPGRVYRTDELDATHTPVFHQVELLAVDEGLTMADLKGTLDHMVQSLFGAGMKTRLRPNFFPFTEPAAEMDMVCYVCRGESVGNPDRPCRTCSSEGWIELGGCGMVNPRVLTACGVDPEKYSGFAFGFGIERMLMFRHNVEDMRDMVEGDVRFTRPFGMEI